MQRMFTRRTFVSMTAASLAARALPAQETTQSAGTSEPDQPAVFRHDLDFEKAGYV